VEFDAKDSVLTAQTKSMKKIDGFQIKIEVGTGSTLYVTNFPPIADEAFIRNLFKDVGSKSSAMDNFSADNVNQFGEIVDIRFPSLKYNTHRRFCYVQFSSSEAAHAATSLDSKQLGEKEFLVAKISAPNQKKERSSATAEGREVYIRNIDFQAKESDVWDIFAKYGRIEKVRLPPGPKKGTHKGFGFVTYESKEEADACLVENGTRLKSREVEVSIAQLNPTKFVPGNAVNATRSMSPAVQQDDRSINGANASPRRGREEASGTPPPDFETIKKKTLGIMNLSDTVNDARLRTLFEPFGPLRKVVLRPAHQGAIVEYENIADAGKASLALDGKELDGMKIRIGELPELMNRQPEKKITKGFEKKTHVQVPTTWMPRPQTLGGRRGRVGGGQRLGLALTHAMSKKPAVSAPVETEGKATTAEGEKKPGSSNEDFKKMFLAGR